MGYRRAEEKDMERLMEIVNDAREYMEECGFVQWTEEYPRRDHIFEDIIKEECYVWEEEGDVLGMMTICLGGEPLYDAGEVAWNTKKPYGAIHRFAVAKEARGKGIAGKLFEAGEEFCFKNHCKGIRIDTYRENYTMRNFLKKNQYEQCGVVYYMEDGKDSERLTYDKILNC